MTSVATFQECVSSWEETASSSSTIPGDIADSPFACFDITLFCSEYKILQSALSTVETDISLGYAIPSDATEAISDFANQLEGFDFEYLDTEDDFAKTALETKAAYRSLRIAYLKGQNARANALNKRIAPLRNKLTSMCASVPMRMIEDE